MPEPVRYYDRLAGKVAIVTGAGSHGDDIGIGRAIAYLLARECAAVACVDIDGDRAAHTAECIVSEGGKAFALAGDVSHPSDCERFVSETESYFGAIDILVNNVGLSAGVGLDAMTLDAWNRTWAVNLTSVMLMCKYAVPIMARRNGGSIVNISSIAGIRAMGALAYGSSKAAMAQLSREIGVLHGRDGIRVNALAPGHIMTPHAMSQVPAATRESRRKVGPLNLEGDAWDVAQAVLFLAGNEARFINGVHLPVDGGVVGIGPLTGHAFITQD
jgi:NAD(P)-dependent dehydrogenase (short-subunit alcohol dehydrogenase family)